MSTLTAQPDRAARRLARRNAPDRLSAGSTLAWSSTGISGAINIIVLSFFTIYATDTLQLPAALVGTVVLVSKLVEAVAVVVAGWVVDRSPETRWGKARPYELAILGVWVGTWALFSTPDLGQTGKLVWVLVCMVLVNAVFISLLGANDVLYLARAFNGRRLIAKVATRTGLFTVLGAVAASVTLPLFLRDVGKSPAAWSQLVLFVAIPMALLGLGRFLFVREKYQTEAPDIEKLTFRDIRDALGSNRYMWIVAMAAAVGAWATGSGIAAYYFRYVVGDIGLMGIMAAVPVLVLPVMLAFPWLMKKMPVSKIITISACSAILGGVVMLFAGANLALIGISAILAGVGVLPITFLTQLLIIDNASYNEWRGRRRLESTMGAITNFAMRLGTGLGAALTGWILGAAGYDGAQATQTPSAITAIIVIAGGLPILLWLGVILVMRSYRSFERLLPTIHADLARRHAEAGLVDAPDADAADETLMHDLVLPVVVPTAGGPVGTLTAPAEMAALLENEEQAPAVKEPEAPDAPHQPDAPSSPRQDQQ